MHVMYKCLSATAFSAAAAGTIVACAGGSDAELIYVGADASESSQGDDDAGYSTYDSAAPSHAGDNANDSGASPSADSAASSDSGGGAPIDAAPDADPLNAPTGSPCTPVSVTQSRPCGVCGTQQRVCLSFDASAMGEWQPWGACMGEVAGGCVPGAQDTQACELCGTRARQCQPDCSWLVGSCTPANPAGVCEPGEIDFEPGLSCDAGTGRVRTCNGQCQWGSFGTTCSQPVNEYVLTASGTVGTVVSSPAPGGAGTWKLKGQLKRLIDGDMTCAITDTSYPQSSQTAYAYVEVRNAKSAPIKVSLWHSGTSNTSDTLMAIYAGAIAPSNGDDAARRACLAGTTAADACPSALNAQCGADFSVAGVTNVTIPANSSIIVYNAYWSTSYADGTFQINVRTDN